MIIWIICSLCIDRKARFSPDSHFVVGVRRKTNRLCCCQSKMMKRTIAYLPRITSAWDLINCKKLQSSVDLRFRSSSSETIVRQAVSWNSWLRHGSAIPSAVSSDLGVQCRLYSASAAVQKLLTSVQPGPTARHLWIRLCFGVWRRVPFNSGL